MTSTFELFLPGRVIFEAGARSQIPGIIKSFGSKALIVHSQSHPLVSGIIGRIESSGVQVLKFGVSGEPTTTSVAKLLEKCAGVDFDCVLGIGGGSVMDTGKGLSALLANPGDFMDYLEIVGKGLPITRTPLPYIAVPTTAGTGSEVTKNAVLSVPSTHIKVSLRSPMMIPRVALIDPELTITMPPDVTASTGMDAIIQLIEPFVSIKSNEFTDGVCRQGLRAAADSIQNAYHHPDDLASRTGMCFASLCGGIALANSGLGAVHGFAGVIGGMYPIPHGMVCAALLAAVLQTNLQALSSRQPGDPVLVKFRGMAEILSQNSVADSFDSVQWAADRCKEFEIPSLSTLGVQREDFISICGKAAASSSMKGNPIMLEDPELLEILELSY